MNTCPEIAHNDSNDIISCGHVCNCDTLIHGCGMFVAYRKTCVVILVGVVCVLRGAFFFDQRHVEEIRNTLFPSCRLL